MLDGSLLTVLEDNFGIAGCPPTPPSPWRQSALIGRQDFSRESFDTIAILPGTERNTPNYRVFGRSLVLAAGPSRLYAADSGSDSILVLGFDGDTLQVFDNPFDRHEVPASAKTRGIRRFIDQAGKERIGNTYLYPQTYPRLGRMIVDTEGNLWMMEYPRLLEPIASDQLVRPLGFIVDPDGARWMVLSQRGQLIAQVMTPPGLFPFEIGSNYVLGITKDEYDVEAVQLHALIR